VLSYNILEIFDDDDNVFDLEFDNNISEPDFNFCIPNNVPEVSKQRVEAKKEGGREGGL